MALPTKAQSELLTIFINAVQSKTSKLTDTSDGSLLDVVGGAASLGGAELNRLIVDQFNKTFIELAGGPDVTGGSDDLAFLAVDHFGDAFARPQATQATDTATFSRPTATAGSVLIPAGSVVKTSPDANGTAYRYTTNGNLTLGVGVLTGNIGITAVESGAASNALAGKINVIESSLLDTTIVVTNAGNNSGTDAQDDATYRETIRNLLQGLRGMTRSAIEGVAKAVAGVNTASALENEINVIKYNPATASVVGGSEYFRVSQVTLYIADSSGNASPTLIANVAAAIEPVRALGIQIDVEAAIILAINWTAAITLNPAGPNYSTFLTDTTLIKQAMFDYIASVPVGTGFVRSAGEAAILAIFGPSGSNDLTAFTTSIPSGDVAAATNQKIFPGTMATA